MRMLWVVLLATCCLVLTAAGSSGAGDTKVHSSGRYFLDASGKPVFFVCHQPASNLDLLPTLVRLAGGRVPKNRVIDGRDIKRLLTVPGASMSPTCVTP